MATKPFKQYFEERTPLVGTQPVEGDEFLVLRAGVVYRANLISTTAYASMEDNAAVTAISGADVWTAIAGTLVQGPTSAAFSFAGNAFTYIGDDQLASSSIMASCSGISQGGGAAEQFEVGVFVNGIQVGGAMQVGMDDTHGGYVSTTIQHTLLNGDVVDMRVQNRNNATDVLLTHAQLAINR